MGISKSNRGTVEYIAGAFIYSGRPDPIWRVGESAVKRLEKIWSGLTYCRDELPIAPPLGYRGCFLRRKPDAEWFAYGGAVTLKTIKGRESRIDKNRNFERLLLELAPKGMLPEEIL